MNKQLITTAIVAAFVASIVLFVGLQLVGTSAVFGANTGANRFPNSTFSTRGLRISTSTNPTTPGDGRLEVTGSSTFSGGVTVSGEVTLSNCGSATFSIPAIGGPTSTASTSVSVAGASEGDVALVAYDAPSATTTLSKYGITMFGDATSSAIIVSFTNNSNVPTPPISSGTITACYFD